MDDVVVSVDVGLVALGAGIAFGCWTLGRSLAQAARVFGVASVSMLGMDVKSAWIDFCDEYRYRTRAMAGRLKPIKEPKLSPDKAEQAQHDATFDAWLASQRDMGEVEREHLAAQYDVVTRKATSSPLAREDARRELTMYGAPLPPA